MTEAKQTRASHRRPVRLLDLMILVAAVAWTLVSPRIMNAIIPAQSLPTWDRRQYVHHLGSLVLLGWTASFAILTLGDAARRGRRSLRGYAPAAMVAVLTSGLFLLALQIPVMILLVVTGGGASQTNGIVWTRLFTVLQMAPSTHAGAILAVWSLLWLTRLGRRPTHWLDWSTYLLGWLWIMAEFLSMLIYYLPIPWLTHSGIFW